MKGLWEQALSDYESFNRPPAERPSIPLSGASILLVPSLLRHFVGHPGAMLSEFKKVRLESSIISNEEFSASFGRPELGGRVKTSRNGKFRDLREKSSAPIMRNPKC